MTGRTPRRSNPTSATQWYRGAMNGTHLVVVGDRGRFVVPQAVRERAGLVEGTPMVLFETDNGLVLLTRSQLRARVKEELAGLDLVGELLGERRSAAAADERE